MQLHGRMQENDDMESRQVSDSMMSRKTLQQNLSKSSFGAKSTSVKEKSYPQKQNRQVNNIFLREKWLDDKEMDSWALNASTTSKEKVHMFHRHVLNSKVDCSLTYITKTS